MFCEQCGAQSPDVAKFCSACGSTLAPVSKTSIATAPEVPSTQALTPIPSENPNLLQPLTNLSVTPSTTSRIKIRVGLLILFVLLLPCAIWVGISQFNDAPQTASQHKIGGLKNQNTFQLSRPVVRKYYLSIPQSAFTVAAGRYRSFRFTVPQGSSNVRMDGRFEATGGKGNDIEVILLDAQQFAEWSSKHKTSVYYASGRINADAFSIMLPPTTDLPAAYYLVFSNTFSLFSNKAIISNIRLNLERPR